MAKPNHPSLDFERKLRQAANKPRSNMVIFPDNGTMKYFYTIVKPLIDQIFSNLKRYHILISIRDSLFLKLMGGKIRAY
jgi:hypothetical protein